MTQITSKQEQTDPAALVRVGVIEDDSRYRAFIIEELRRHPRIEKVTEFRSAEEYIRDEAAGFLDLLFIDLMLPNMRGDELVSLVRERNPDTIICMLSASLEEGLVFTCLRNGAVGYAWKEDVGSIQDVVTTLLSGGGIITPSVAVLIAEHLHGQPSVQAELTPREKQILDLMTSGMQAIAVAKFLGITENTIRGHIKNIYKKLQVKSLSQLHAKLRSAENI